MPKPWQSSDLSFENGYSLLRDVVITCRQVTFQRLPEYSSHGLFVTNHNPESKPNPTTYQPRFREKHL